MKIATLIVRSLLGLMFVLSGSNMVLHFVPLPLPAGDSARAFMAALIDSHFLYVVAAFEVVGGLLMVTGRWAPLGLALLAPVIVNIVVFHVLMDPAGVGIGCVVAALALFLAWRYRRNFAGLVNKAPVVSDSPVK
jgi:putative oxidoreductase